MLKSIAIPINESGVLNKLLTDYVGKQPELKNFYEAFPDHAGFESWKNSHQFPKLDRKQLSDILLAQAHSVKNTTEQTIVSIERLKSSKCYTVTTGHQLCLFTGPLYFIYKIFSAIVLAEKLKIKFPENDFVPVYWMATEDHDFAEINHFIIESKKLQWHSNQNGAVGEFSTTGLQSVLNELKTVLGSSPASKKLIRLFEKSYLEHDNLAQATRFLVNELFGTYGIVTVDGNDAAFKKQFVSEFRSDLFSQTPFQFVNEKSEALSKLGYHAQVNAREINCFYLEKGSRLRIERDADNFGLAGTDRKFTADELEVILQNHPERISPNVVLRPLYQQKILPNIAYVGGPGELAYWLEFKSMFDHFNIPYPILVPRSFVTLVNAATAKTINKLELSASQVYESQQSLIKILQAKLQGIFNLENEEKNIRKIYAEILQRTTKVDKTLDGKVNAELQRALNSLESIAGKTNKALRRKMDDQIRLIEQLHLQILPNKIPQERVENFSGFYMLWKDELFEILHKNCDPLLFQQLLIVDEV